MIDLQPKTKDWPKMTLEWTECDKAYLSVPFTWNLPEAFSKCVYMI